MSSYSVETSDLWRGNTYTHISDSEAKFELYSLCATSFHTRIQLFTTRVVKISDKVLVYAWEIGIWPRIALINYKQRREQR